MEDELKVSFKATQTTVVNSLSDTVAFPIVPGTLYFTADGYIVYDFQKLNPETNTVVNTRTVINSKTADTALSASQLKHTITIGTTTYDGTEDVSIPVFNGLYTQI